MYSIVIPDISQSTGICFIYKNLKIQSNMRIPKISIIVPIYKAEAYIQRCIDSIINQSFQDWECILIDDGSPDKSGAICDRYAITETRIKVLHTENGGVSSARNKGIELSRGEYLVFVDSDDEILPDYIKKLYEGMMLSSLPVLSVCGAVSQSDVRCETYRKFNNSFYSFTDSDDKECVLLYGGMLGKMYNRNVVNKHVIRFNESITNCEDCLFMWDYLSIVSDIVTNEYQGYVYYIGDNENSLTQKQKDPFQLFESHQLLLERFITIVSYYPSISNVTKKRVYNWIFELEINAIKQLYAKKTIKTERALLLSKIDMKTLRENYHPYSVINKVFKFCYCHKPTMILVDQLLHSLR